MGKKPNLKRYSYNCVVCEAPFVAKKSNAYCCGRKCAEIRRTRDNPPKPKPAIQGRDCRWCGEVFTPTDSRQRYCSQKCNWDKANNVVVLRRWGLTVEQYAAMTVSGCEVCGSHDALRIDHDHDCCPTYKDTCGKCIRGILCNKCNTAEGMLKSDPELAMSLAFYMAKNVNVLELANDNA